MTAMNDGNTQSSTSEDSDKECDGKVTPEKTTAKTNDTKRKGRLKPRTPTTTVTLEKHFGSYKGNSASDQPMPPQVKNETHVSKTTEHKEVQSDKNANTIIDWDSDSDTEVQASEVRQGNANCSQGKHIPISTGKVNESETAEEG